MENISSFLFFPSDTIMGSLSSGCNTPPLRYCYVGPFVETFKKSAFTCQYQHSNIDTNRGVARIFSEVRTILQIALLYPPPKKQTNNNLP